MEKRKNIFLIGPRACGKTSVGRALADKLGLDFVDTDHALVDRVGMEIADYVEKHGWDRFREEETETLRRIAEKGGQVVGCGGGVVLREVNREMLGAGVTLYLHGDPEVLAQRLAKDPNEAQRPSLTGKHIVDEVRDVLAERAPLYEECADALIADGPLDEVVERAVEAAQRLDDF